MLLYFFLSIFNKVNIFAMASLDDDSYSYNVISDGVMAVTSAISFLSLFTTITRLNFTHEMKSEFQINFEGEKKIWKNKQTHFARLQKNNHNIFTCYSGYDFGYDCYKDCQASILQM